MSRKTNVKTGFKKEKDVKKTRGLEYILSSYSLIVKKKNHQNQNRFTNKKAKETGHPYDTCHSGIQQNLINTLLRSPVFLVF